MVVALLYEMQSPCNCFTLSLSARIVVEVIVGEQLHGDTMMEIVMMEIMMMEIMVSCR